MKQLLLLHGALGTQQQFSALKTILAPTYHVHDFNFSGHGGKSAPADFSIELFTQDTLNYIQEHSLGPVSVFGYSMGGYVALNLAKKFPQLVDRILTLGTKFDWTKETAAKEVKMLNPEKILEKVPAFAQSLSALHAPNDWKEMMRKTAAMMLDLGDGNGLHKSDLQEIQQTVLIALGSLDRMVGQEESEEAAQLLPNGTFRLMEGFKHPIEQVDKQQLATMIADWMNG